MKLLSVQSWQDLEKKLKETPRSYLLLFKSGSPASECAFQAISQVDGRERTGFFAGDVSTVRDIHTRFGIETVPTLLQIEESRVVNSVKGCQTPALYSTFMNNDLPTVKKSGGENSQPPVEVYTTPTCTYCTQIKKHLNQHNIRFREIDISKDSKMADLLVKKTGQTGVPQTNIGGQWIVGFNKPKINRLLGINE